MSQVCPRCGPDIRYPDEEPFCPIHVSPLEPYDPAVDEPEVAEDEADPSPEPSPPPEPSVPVDPSRCWNCGTPPPNASNSECLNPDCRSRLLPPALLIRFRDGQIELDRGERVELGRVGRHASLFRSFLNVSKRHAVVGVDTDGHAWIEPAPTPNGTFVDGREIAASVRRSLRSGQLLRFALHAEGAVTLFRHGGTV